MPIVTRFSAVIYHLGEKEVAWFREMFRLDRYGGPVRNLTKELRTTEGELSLYDVFDWPGFDYRFDEEPSGISTLLLTDREGYLNSKHIFALAQTYFTKFRPYSYLSVHYTYGRDKPVDGSFWGGCYFITKDYVKSATMHDWESAQVVRWSTLDL